MLRTRISIQELDDEICEVLPAREELAVIDTGFTNPGMAAAGAGHHDPDYVVHKPTVYHQQIYWTDGPDHNWKGDHDWSKDYGDHDYNKNVHHDNGKHLGWYKQDWKYDHDWKYDNRWTSYEGKYDNDWSNNHNWKTDNWKYDCQFDQNWNHGRDVRYDYTPNVDYRMDVPRYPDYSQPVYHAPYSYNSPSNWTYIAPNPGYDAGYGYGPDPIQSYNRSIGYPTYGTY